jgi:hypothetical protein
MLTTETKPPIEMRILMAAGLLPATALPAQTAACQALSKFDQTSGNGSGGLINVARLFATNNTVTP